jgi:hypothetical protein
MKVSRLSAIRIGRLYPTEDIPASHFCQRLSWPKGDNAAGRIESMGNCNEMIRNGTRDLPACSAVPDPNVPPLPFRIVSEHAKIYV